MEEATELGFPLLFVFSIMLMSSSSLSVLGHGFLEDCAGILAAYSALLPSPAPGVCASWMTVASLCVSAWKNRPKCITTRLWCPIWCLESGDHIGKFTLTPPCHGSMTRNLEVKEKLTNLPPLLRTHPVSSSLCFLYCCFFLSPTPHPMTVIAETLFSNCWKQVFTLKIKLELMVSLMALWSAWGSLMLCLWISWPQTLGVRTALRAGAGGRRSLGSSRSRGSTDTVDSVCVLARMFICMKTVTT